MSQIENQTESKNSRLKEKWKKTPYYYGYSTDITLKMGFENGIENQNESQFEVRLKVRLKISFNSKPDWIPEWNSS